LLYFTSSDWSMFLIELNQNILKVNLLDTIYHESMPNGI
jgi:hypothetical protein